MQKKIELNNKNKSFLQMFTYIERHILTIKENISPSDIELILKYRVINEKLEKIKLEIIKMNDDSDEDNAEKNSQLRIFNSEERVERDVMVKFLKYEKFLLSKKISDKSVNTIKKLMLNE
jgi:hypothetical protein